MLVHSHTPVVKFNVELVGQHTVVLTELTVPALIVKVEGQVQINPSIELKIGVNPTLQIHAWFGPLANDEFSGHL